MPWDKFMGKPSASAILLSIMLSHINVSQWSLVLTFSVLVYHSAAAWNPCKITPQMINQISHLHIRYSEAMEDSHEHSSIPKLSKEQMKSIWCIMKSCSITLCCSLEYLDTWWLGETNSLATCNYGGGSKGGWLIVHVYTCDELSRKLKFNLVKFCNKLMVQQCSSHKLWVFIIWFFIPCSMRCTIAWYNASQFLMHMGT